MKLCATALCALLAAPAAAQELKTDQDKTLYALGIWLGQKVTVFGLNEAELKLVSAGLKDAVLGKKPQVELNEFGNKLNDLAQSRMSAKAEEQKKKDAAFIEKAAKEKGAEKTASGLVYVEQSKGKGKSPKAEDTVKVHYVGTLTNGEKFDSSRDRGEPAEFPLNGVIPCWTEGVQKMKAGGKAKLVCPSSIAYGDAGSPPKIPGGATLVFEIELLDVKSSDKK